MTQTGWVLLAAGGLIIAWAAQRHGSISLSFGAAQIEPTNTNTASTADPSYSAQGGLNNQSGNYSTGWGMS